MSRANAAESFGNPVNLGPSVNSKSGESGGQLSADRLTLVFRSDRRGGQGGLDLWMSERPAIDQPFGEAVNLGYGVNSRASETGPALSADGLTLIFHSSRSNGRGHDLWQSRRPDRNSPWANPRNMGSINSGGLENRPSLSSDGLTLVFTSDRRGGIGGADIWICTRAAEDQDFGEPKNLSPKLNTPRGEYVVLLMPDASTLLFLRDGELHHAPIKRPGSTLPMSE